MSVMVSQLMFFTHGVIRVITEELASVHSMHGTTVDKSLFKEAEKDIAGCALHLMQWKYLTADWQKCVW
jgi:hypothetical protein